MNTIVPLIKDSALGFVAFLGLVAAVLGIVFAVRRVGERRRIARRLG